MPDSDRPRGVDMAARVVRHADLVPCLNAFVDTRTPGSDRKENFTIIGPGVSESPGQHIHIREAHGFNIGGARQPPGCVNSQHSHDTAEVFFVHSGRWRFMTGENASDGSIELARGDLISLPTKLFRGFENVGEEIGFLWAILGGDDPGRVLWAPYVFDMAEKYGLVLLESGRLVDRAVGETVPADETPMPRTGREQVDALQVMDSAALRGCVVRAGDKTENGPLSDGRGVRERRLVGCTPLDWPHGFTVSEIALEPGAVTAGHAFDMPDVWFVHVGEIRVQMGDADLVCGPGDTITHPPGVTRAAAALDGPGRLVAVRGRDGPPPIRRV